MEPKKEPAAWAQALQSQIGRTPAARLRWLLEALVYKDVRKLPDRELQELRLSLLVLLQTTLPDWNYESPIAEVREVFSSDDEDMAGWQKLPEVERTWLRTLRHLSRPSPIPLEDGRTVTPPLPSGPAFRSIRGSTLPHTRRLLLKAQEVVRRVVGGTPGYPLGRVRILRWPRVPMFIAPLPEAMAVVAMTLLRQAPEGTLRQCAFEDRGRRCPHRFIAKTRQRWCVEHQAHVRRSQWAEAQRRRRRAKPRKPSQRAPRADNTSARVGA